MARLKQKWVSAKPISEDTSLTQHLIALVQHPGRYNGFVNTFGSHSIMNDTTSIGLVVKDILYGHS